jgi:HEAT repeat protein
MVTTRCLIATLTLILLTAAGVALAQTPAESAWKVLDAGMSDSNVTERTVAVRVLGLIHDDSRAIEMAEKALEDKNPEVRAAGAQALGKMGSKGSIEKLQALLKDTESPVVMAATESLKTLGDTKAYEVYFAILTGERKSGQGLIQEQMKMLHDPKKMAEFGFSQGIGYVPYAGLALGAYKAIHKDDTSPLRAVAAVALASDPDPRSGEALVTAASDKSLIVRTAALDAIAYRNDPGLITAIVPMMNDDKDVIRYTAAAAVVRLSKIAK